MATIKEKVLIYHQTELDNLESIIEYGLLSRARIQTRNVSFKNVADPEIIKGRSETGLENYVPFHFHPRTLFDYRIRNDHPNDAFVFLCMYRETARKRGALILPAHPLSNKKPQLFSYADGFNKIKWDKMELTQQDEGYDSQVRMAECLIRDEVAIRDIAIIYVRNTIEEEIVKSLLAKKHIVHIKVYVGDKFFG